MKNWVVAVVVMVVGLAVAATFFFMRSSVVHLVEPGDSMNPTSHRGDDMTVVDVAEVHRGDIIVFDPTGWPDRDEFQGFLVKRVIGVGGDVIVSTSTQLKVNGKTIAEGYTQKDPDEAELDNYTVTVPPGQVFVAGDNRSNSVDSRMFGDRGGVPPDHVMGVVVAVNGNALTPTKAFTDAASAYFGGQKINQVLTAAAGSVAKGWTYLPYQLYANSIYSDTVGKSYLNGTAIETGLAAWQQALVDYGNQQGFTVSAG
ncbi:signal peptidase I [Kibdelosporangium lantanae]|uniref:Signal peptidase I n=1 Tax=Kibdelosporangium lantanae TaxID=1497396 RepID=A0ABW3MDR3_9PSEU